MAAKMIALKIRRQCRDTLNADKRTPKRDHDSDGDASSADEVDLGVRRTRLDNWGC